VEIGSAALDGNLQQVIDVQAPSSSLRPRFGPNAGRPRRDRRR
jgi:hypothetical protein